MTKKRRFLSLLIVLTIFATMAPWSALVASASFTGVLQFDNEGKFTVLQLADIQENKDVDPGTIDLITRAIARYSPDLVVLTGDNVKGLISSTSVHAAIDQFLAPLISTNTKFAVTFGNHDDLGPWPNPGTREEQYAYYKSKGGSLFIDHDVPALDGTGSGSIPIYSYGQSSGTPTFQVFLMDSGTYNTITYTSLDAIKTSQIDYFLTNNPTVPSLWFQHIPVPDMYYNLLNQVPSGTANSFEGSHDPFKDYTWALNNSLIDWKASGSVNPADIYKEAPGPPDLSTYQDTAHRSSAIYGSKTLYEAWLANGKMKGAFFGHNHYNSFVGTTADGITLGFAKGATLEAYNDGNPGCRVFEIDDSGSYTTISATRSSLTNYNVADYTPVNNAIAAARFVNNGNTYFRANNNDPNYFNPTSTTIGNGVFAPSSFVGNAAELQEAIDSVEHNLDTRSQSSINAVAASITATWNAISLKYADYSAVNQVLSYAAGGTILAPEYYNATHSGEMLPNSYYTNTTLAAWDAACNSVVSNLKQPSQTTVNGFASSLQAAYQELRLKPEYEIANIEVFIGSTTVINNSNHFIFGLVPGVTQADFENSFVKLYGNAHLVFTLTLNGFGTGTKVELIENSTGAVLETYFIVIFGDVNGDGNIDSIDAGSLVDFENGIIAWYPNATSPYYLASDLNGDGNVDSMDAGIAVDFENKMVNINQGSGLVS